MNLHSCKDLYQILQLQSLQKLNILYKATKKEKNQDSSFITENSSENNSDTSSDNNSNSNFSSLDSNVYDELQNKKNLKGKIIKERNILLRAIYLIIKI